MRETDRDSSGKVVAAQRDVGRFQITMDDSLLVRDREGFGNLPRDRYRLVDRYRSALEAIGERLAFDEFENEELRRSGLIEPVDSRAADDSATPAPGPRV
jgi:hypothetical protein